MNPPIQPGDVLKIPEADYLYGTGDLILRVAEVYSVQHLLDGDWLAIKGTQLARNEAELTERKVLVRSSRLSRSQERT